MVKFGSSRRVPAKSSFTGFTVTLTLCHILSIFVILVGGLVLLNASFLSEAMIRMPSSSSLSKQHSLIGADQSRRAVRGAPLVVDGKQQHNWFDPEHTRTFNEGSIASSATHLVIVAGHSVTISGHLHDADHDESDWFLLDYQKGHGLPEAIIGHIRAGIDVASNDPNALLVFSGGETRGVAGPETEGASYFRVADAMELWPSGSSARSRTVTEDFARDSFENL